MNPDPEGSRGSEGGEGGARHLVARVLQLLATRLELFSLELAEERRALVAQALRLVIGAILGFYGSGLLLLAGILAVKPEWRPMATLAAGLILAGGGVWLFARVRRQLRDRPPPFAATLSELQRDREWLRTLK